jgi:hypothetical protein
MERDKAKMLTILGSECPAICVDVLADIIILGKVEELPDLGCPLGSPHPGLLSVSQAGKIILTLLDNHQVDNRQVLADNATTDRLPPALTITPAIPTEARSAYKKHKQMSHVRTSARRENNSISSLEANAEIPYPCGAEGAHAQKSTLLASLGNLACHSLP